MPLAPGTRIGPYEVSGALGAGGMGEVYRARDLKLNRDVALKILPDAVASDPDRLSRFRREAQVLAALNHPHIAQIYGFEDSAGTQALVMEFVDGLTLQEHIERARNGLPLVEVLSLANQIAQALEAAHEQGIIHRDLKPANIKVRSDGAVRVLDFGLAKALDPAGASNPEAMNAPTLTSPAMTERGVILGTAAYMAPEQARGKTVDKRADIWAFGAVLYEMLTGTRAFRGEGLSDTLAAVVRHEIDWRRLPGDTPPRLRQLLARCLEPDVKQRLRDIGEARVAIAAIERGEGDPVTGSREAAPATQRGQARLAWAVAAIAVLAAVMMGVWQKLSGSAESPGAATEVARLSVLPPPGLLMNADSTNTAISPNGRLVAFVVGVGISTENQLWVRPIDSSAGRRIDGGDGASQPFWSPDSERIGFFASRKLKTVAAAGGAATIVCDAPFGRGATWNASNIIVFAPDSIGPLYRVPAGSGTPAPVTTIDSARKEEGHRFPAFLPDNDHFLFAALPGADGVFQIFAGSLQDPKIRIPIGVMESAPIYANPGWLLFTRQGVLAAQPFDAKALKTTGDALTLGDEPTIARTTAAYDAGRRVSASVAGSLAYYFEPSANVRVQWLDNNAKVAGGVSVPPARYSYVTIAPDGTRAVLVRSDSQNSSSLWLADLRRESFVPILMNGNRSPMPVWSPDSTRIAFHGERDGRRGIYEKAVAEASSERPIVVDNNAMLPQGWSKDLGIIFNQIDPGTKWNVHIVPVSGQGAPRLLVGGPSIEVGGWPSPDNHWLAYQSDEAGSLDLFVQPFPGPGARTQVATGGIQTAWWTPDGRRLLYLKRDQSLWQVDVDFRIAPARVGAPAKLAAFPSTLVAMDLAPDGQRFLALVPEQAGLGAVTVVERWQAALPARR